MGQGLAWGAGRGGERRPCPPLTSWICPCASRRVRNQQGPPPHCAEVPRPGLQPPWRGPFIVPPQRPNPSSSPQRLSSKQPGRGFPSSPLTLGKVLKPAGTNYRESRTSVPNGASPATSSRAGLALEACACWGGGTGLFACCLSPLSGLPWPPAAGIPAPRRPTHFCSPAPHLTPLPPII